MLIRRYLFKEITHTFFAVILVVLLIAVCNKFVRLVGKAAAGDVPPDVLFQIMLFQIPEIFAFLLPVALFLAILLCYGRFFTDNEIPVMLACGISWQRLLAVSLGMSLLVMLMSASLTCYFSPKLAQYREQLLHKDAPTLLVQTVAPGRFHSIHQDRLVFYVEELNADRSELQNIFVAEQPKGNASSTDDWSLLTAESGNIVTDEQNGITYVKLAKGRRYNGTPGDSDYTVLEFDGFAHLVESVATPEGLFFHRTMPTRMLWDNPSAGNDAELQWRLAIPLSAPLLALLAVSLSRVSPRGGRFGKMFIAIVLCIVYYNLLTLSKRWVAKQTLSPEIGLWWVHALLLLLGLVMLARISGRWQQGISYLRRLSKGSTVHG